MKKVLALGAVLLLAACGGNDKLSKADVQEALEESGRYGKVCVPFGLDIADAKDGAGVAAGIVGMEEIRLLKRLDNGKRANLQAMKQMDILVDAGIYEEEGTERLGHGEHTIRYVVYRLTDHGRRQFSSDAKHGPLLCIGDLDVQKIHYYTEPTAANGLTVSHVSFEAKIRTERWARKLLADNPFYKGLEGTETRSVTLVKTNQGWRDVHTLSRY